MEPSANLEADRIGSPVQLRLIDQYYDGRTLAGLLAKKILRRLRRPSADLQPIVSYRGLVVFDWEDLDGGGLYFGADYPRVLLELGIGRVQRALEFCAGPGYIGYMLLSMGFCDALVLADINSRAIRAAEHTAQFNALERRVTVYQSDCLDGIPQAEKFDLVVGNPPHFLESGPEHALRAKDENWRLHERFYATIKPFMNPGGRVVLVENTAGSSPDVFIPMITKANGQFEGVIEGTDGTGRANGFYFIVSRW